jgi:hypothetical protein
MSDFSKILIANRDDDRRDAPGAAKPQRMVRGAHAGDLTAEMTLVQ